MKNAFKEIESDQIADNPFKLIGEDWMLITAGSMAEHNTMTASWGGLGVLWDRHICICFVRPTRHTWQFMETAEHFTLSFFAEEHRAALAFCGSHSGRDVNKEKKTGLTPFETDSGAVSFAQARLVIEARRIYSQDLDPQRFREPAVNEFNPAKDYHRMYIGEIVRCLAR